jgi:hypothetical protein
MSKPTTGAFEKTPGWPTPELQRQLLVDNPVLLNRPHLWKGH